MASLWQEGKKMVRIFQDSMVVRIVTRNADYIVMMGIYLDDHDGVEDDI